MGKYFIGGKYKGKQADWVLVRDRNYYTWAILNAPNLIKDDSPKPEKRLNPLSPNYNFLNEGPFRHDA